MPSLTIWIPTFDDCEQLEHALDSIAAHATSDLEVFVVDGRYRTFEGDTDLTPGAEDLADAYEFASYAVPPDLPLGDPDEPDEFRSPQHEQAKWVNYELLPADEWVMEMDTDERLQALDLDALDDLNETYKWSPMVVAPEGEQLLPAIRIYQPQYWTPWIDDVMFWREHYPRETTSLRDLAWAHATSAHRNTNYGGVVEDIEILNKGMDRPEEYQKRRADQLETMGVDLAAQAVRDGKQPSLVDLEAEYGP